MPHALHLAAIVGATGVLMALGSTSALAETVLLTPDEIRTQIVGKTLFLSHVDGKQSFVMELAEGGKATVSRTFNDVGRWRMNDAGAGYCVSWNKLGDERCSKIARVDGKLVIIDGKTDKITASVEIRRVTHRRTAAALQLNNVLTLSSAQVAIEAAATVAFALSGLLAAARKRLDAVGVCIVAGLAAFGGGTLRDILLDRRPFFWVEHALWLWLLLALCVIAMLFMRSRHFAATERAMQWPDALGLGLFAANGTQIALTAGMPPVVAVLMGVMTAVFGGVLRDIVCNEIPSAFRDHQPYAVCAFSGGWMLVAMHALGVVPWLSLVAAAGAATLLRVCALAWGWTLPAWRTGD